MTAYQSDSPPSLYEPMMTYDPVDQYVVLFGGMTEYVSSKETWTFSHNHWSQLFPQVSPPAEYGGGFVWDTKDGYAVLFGGVNYQPSYTGFDSEQLFNETWTFVHGEWTNATATTDTTPSARSNPEMSWDSQENCVVMFGGEDLKGASSSTTWKFSGGKWTPLSTATAPAGRWGGGMADDPGDNSTALFGGAVTGAPVLSATWSFRNDNWTAPNPVVHPSGRYFFGFDYSPLWREDILVGGEGRFTTGHSTETWSFSNGSWTDLTASLLRSPAPPGYGGFAFDTGDGYGVYFAAHDYFGGIAIPETWILGPSLFGELRTGPWAEVGQATVLNATPFSSVGNATYLYTQLPKGCVSENTSRLFCVPTAAGSYSLSVIVTDSLGRSILESTRLTVNPALNISSFSAAPSSITTGGSFRLSSAASGGAGQLHYSYSGLPPGCYTVNAPAWTCTPVGGAAGNFTVWVTATDELGVSLTTPATVVINAVPTTPAVVLSPSTIDVGQADTIRVSPAGGTPPYLYAYSGLPEGCVGVDAPSVSCTPDTPGTSTVVVNITDAYGYRSTGAAILIVNPDPFVYSFTVSSAVIDVGETIGIQATAGGGTGVLSYHYSGLPPGCLMGNQSAKTCLPSRAGEFAIAVEVHDQDGVVARAGLHLSVHPPLELLGVTVSRGELEVGQPVSIVASALHGTPPLSYLYSGLPYGCKASGSDTTVQCTPSRAGDYVVELRVADAFETSPPVAAEILVHPDVSITAFWATPTAPAAGSEVDLHVRAIAGAAGFTYTYTNLPPGCIPANTANLSCGTPAAGSFVVGVTVVDSIGSSSNASLRLLVNAPTRDVGILGLSATTGSVLLVAVPLGLLASGLVLHRSHRRRRERPDVDFRRV